MFGRSAAVLLSLVLLFAPTSSVSGQPTIQHAGSFMWFNITQDACMQRATAALTAAARQFGFREQVQNLGWYAVLESADLHVGIHCMADDGTSGDVINPSARRVAAIATMHTTRAQRIDGPVRDFITECMKANPCGTAQPPVVQPPVVQPPNPPSAPGATPAAGRWVSAGSTVVWDFVAAGPNRYTWFRADINESGQLTLNGGRFDASWTGPGGAGGGAGAVQYDASGRVTRFIWDNGAVFTRVP